jgi:hypothetical protein
LPSWISAAEEFFSSISRWIGEDFDVVPPGLAVEMLRSGLGQKNARHQSGDHGENRQRSAHRLLPFKVRGA